MKKYELDILAELLSDKVADKVLKRLGKVPVDAQDEMVDSKEAARMIGVSPAYIRQLKDRIPHVKAGQHKQGRSSLSSPIYIIGISTHHRPVKR